MSVIYNNEDSDNYDNERLQGQEHAHGQQQRHGQRQQQRK